MIIMNYEKNVEDDEKLTFRLNYKKYCSVNYLRI